MKVVGLKRRTPEGAALHVLREFVQRVADDESIRPKALRDKAVTALMQAEAAEVLAAPTLDDIGAEVTPIRYSMRHDHETIDRMRQLCRDLAEQALLGSIRWHRLTRLLGVNVAMTNSNALGDLAFAFLCKAMELRYRDRAGLKGLAVADEAKADWYSAMAEHVLDPSYPDPRTARPGWQPTRQWIL
jgi:hypothetical protein